MQRASEDTSPRSPWRVAGLAVLSVGLGNLFTEVVLYGWLVAPRMATMPKVPVSWWIGIYLPVLLACIAVVPALRVRRDVLVAGLAAGAITQLEKLGLALVQAPGHLTSLAVEDPPRFWTLHFARTIFGFVVLFALLYAAGSRARRRAR